MKLPDFLFPCDIEVERNIILETLREKIPEYQPLRGDDFNILIDCFLFRLNKYINYINYIISQNYLPYSSGEFLDSLVGLAGIERFRGSAFESVIQISASSPLVLPKGTKFIDKAGHSAFLKENLIINDSLEAKANIELENGVSGDFDTVMLEIPHIYVKEIKKLTPFTQKQSPESDEELKKRFLLSLTTPSTAGSLKSYQYLSSIPEVSKSKIKHKDLGVVEIIYEASSASALQSLKDSIEPNIPITDTIIYTEVSKIPLDLNITLTLKDISNITSITNEINQQVRGLFSHIDIEESVSVSKIIAVSFVSEDITEISVDGLVSMEENSIYDLRDLKIGVKDESNL